MIQINLRRNLVFILMLSMYTAYSSAQLSKVAIISLADTTIVHQHIGRTMFTNFTDTLYLDVAVTQYLEQQLNKYLSQN